MSDEIILERRGGDMWYDLKKWLEIALESCGASGYMELSGVKEQMKEIEKEYGITD